MPQYFIPGVTEEGPAYLFDTDPGTPYVLWTAPSTKATKATKQAPAPENEV